jgi:beta-lactam-binding protein with PASTA domain
LRRLASWVAWFCGAAALGVSAFAVSFYLAMKVEMRSSEVSVPDLVGLRQDQAEQLARPLNLVVDVVDQRNDPTLSSGRILQQEPAAGAAVRRGRKVKVVLSLGGKVLEVPALRGQGARAAEIELGRAGFQLGPETRVFSGDLEPGAILSQVPPPGARRARTRISLLVSEVSLSPGRCDLAGRPRAGGGLARAPGIPPGPVRWVATSERRPERSWAESASPAIP